MVHNCLIIGGGVVGLSIAYELATCGQQVRILEQGTLGREASWAGAGILPPPPARRGLPPWERLHALSYELHRQWHERLLAETGIDNGLRQCGGIYLARRGGEAAALRAQMIEWAEDAAEVRQLSAAQLAELEPAIAQNRAAPIRAAFLLPAEAQIRNPRHLAALAAACCKLGVEVVEGARVEEFELAGNRVFAAVSSIGRFAADQFCLTAGAWSGTLAARLGLNLPVYPVRGQMVLYRCQRRLFTHILNEGPRYLVPRDDGRVLAGSTEEDVGFDKRTTAAAIGELRQFAQSLVPELADAQVEQTWAGLRPHAVDGFPYLGRVPHLQNVFVAAGHYRSGLATSTGTARLIRQLICGQEPEIDISEFRVNR